MLNSESILLQLLLATLYASLAIVYFGAANRLAPTHRLHEVWAVPITVGILLLGAGLFSLISCTALAAESLWTGPPTITLFPVVIVCGISTVVTCILALQLWHQFHTPSAPIFDEDFPSEPLTTASPSKWHNNWAHKPLQTCGALLLLHTALLGSVSIISTLLFTPESFPAMVSVASLICMIVICQGLALCVAARIALHPSDLESSIRQSAVERLLRGFAVLMGVFAALSFVWVFLILLALVVFFTILSSRHQRKVDRLTALWILTNVVQSGRPPETELRQQLESTYSRVRTLLEQLLMRLTAGESWNRSLCASGIAPQSAWMEICTTAETRQFPEMLLTTARRETDRFTRQGDSIRARLAFGYFHVTIILLLVVLNFIGYYLVPKLKRILEDINEYVDPTIQRIFSLLSSSELSLFSLLVVAVILVPAFMAEMGIELVLWQRLVDRLPFFRRRNRLTPDLLRALHWSVRDNVPLEVALEEAAEAPIGFDARSRLHQAAAAIREGRDPWESLQHTDWLTRDQVQLLQSAHAARNLPWALATLSDSISAGRDYRRQWWLQILHPCLIVLLAMIVGLAGYAIFGTLTQMTGHNA